MKLFEPLTVNTKSGKHVEVYYIGKSIYLSENDYCIPRSITLSTRLGSKRPRSSHDCIVIDYPGEYEINKNHISAYATGGKLSFVIHLAGYETAHENRTVGFISDEGFFNELDNAIEDATRGCSSEYIGELFDKSEINGKKVII